MSIPVNPVEDELDKILLPLKIYCDTENTLKPIAPEETYNGVRAALLAWHSQGVGEAVETLVKQAFKAATYQNIDGAAKYWSAEGDYNANAMNKFFPQEWFDERFVPALKELLDD